MGYVVPGATGLAGTIDVADPANGAALIIQAAPFAFTVFSDIAVSGAGDVNGDGIGDLVVGATSANPHDRVFAGASYVVFGGPAAALERLIAEVDAADLPRRLENRLTRNLENALEDVTDNKISRAILRLRTFVGKVKAQRGKKIDKAVADDWIADAEAIIDTLKAQRRQRAPQNRTLGSMAGAP